MAHVPQKKAFHHFIKQITKAVDKNQFEKFNHLLSSIELKSGQSWKINVVLHIDCVSHAI